MKKFKYVQPIEEYQCTICGIGTWSEAPAPHQVVLQPHKHKAAPAVFEKEYSSELYLKEISITSEPLIEIGALLPY